MYLLKMIIVRSYVQEEKIELFICIFLKSAFSELFWKNEASHYF